LTKAVSWLGIAALVVLGARTLAYALAPVPTVRTIELEQAVGGPRVVIVAAVAVGLALALAIAIVGLAALAVRERAALERKRITAPPRLRFLTAAVRFSVLFVVTCAAFALVESTIHWEDGLGWHGLHCLVGPVHRDAIPLLAALSLVAVALVTAVEHLLAWARRTFAALRAQPRLRARRPRAQNPRIALRPRPWVAAALPPRGPPQRCALHTV